MKISWIHEIIGMLAIALVASVTCADAPAGSEAARRLVIGEHKDLEVIQPRRGFLGGPYDVSGIPTWRVPAREEDFYKRYVRITVLEKREFPEWKREYVVFRLDELASRPEYTGDPLLYYGFVDLSEPGGRIVGVLPEHGILPRRTHMGLDKVPPPNNIIMDEVHELPFPLLLTCPAANAQFSVVQKNGSMQGDMGIVYVETGKEGLGEGNREFESILLRRWYPNSGSADEERADAADHFRMSVVARETQIWAADEDWLWKSMERRDDSGHITMKCRQMAPDEILDTSLDRHGIQTE